MMTTMPLTPRLGPDAIALRVRMGCAAASSSARVMLAYGLVMLAGLLAWLNTWAHASLARADAGAALPLLSPHGLNGGRYVGSAFSDRQLSLRFAATLGYGFTESVLAENDRHHRLAGELAAALVVAPWFQAALAGELRLDAHTGDGEGNQPGLLGSSRVLTRHMLPLGDRLAIGFSPEVQFPGADDVRHGFQAASYELKALFGARLGRNIELALHGGFRFDRTRDAVEDALNLPPPQRLAASLSDQNATLLGALVSVPLGAFRLAGEWSWELQTKGHMNASNSPMRVRAVLQRAVGERFLPAIELGFDSSARPTFVGLTRIEPRVWARIGLGIVLERRKAPPKPAVVAAPAAPQTPALRTVTLRVLDDRERPIVGARVTVPNDTNHDEYATDAEGDVTLKVGSGVTAVTVEAQGYEPLWRTLGSEAQNTTAVVLKPGLPPAEIKGVVRNLAGDPLQAVVTLSPGALSVNTDAQGQFVLGIAPGDYTLTIEAEGYEPQERPAQVEFRGVTIVVIDLRKAAK
jgi:hypothetical protein